jgi:hypothetical protein
MIIYPNQTGGICLVIPTGELAIEEVARKDVPVGVPFLFVTADQLPENDFFDAWEADFSNPDGYGIGAEAWFAEQEAKKAAEEVPA